MRGSDRKTFVNVSATPAAFQLEGGYYVIDVNATFGPGSITLQRLSIDNATFLTAITPITANGITPIYLLTAGTYQFALASVTNAFIKIERVTGTAI